MTTDEKVFAGWGTTIGLDGSQLDRIFPFHFAFDRSLRVVQIGHSTSRTCPGMEPGSWLPEFVTLSSPRVELTFEELVDHQNSLILFKTFHDVTLRGQIVEVDSELLCFVGSPWVTDPTLLGQMGITLSDFALHDSVADYMFLLQAQTTALEDARRFAERLQEIDEEKARLANAEEALARELNALPDLVIRMDRKGLLLNVRPANESILNAAPSDLIGTSAYEAFPEMGHQLRDCLQRAFEFGKTQSFEYQTQHRDGVGYYEARVVRSSEDEALALVRDVSERHELQRQLMHQAFHDPLTSLANRALFEDRVSHALARAREASEVSVLFIDLDDFKMVNDTLGHRVGDALLVAVAARLAEWTGPADTVARLGGDEFAVLIEKGEWDFADSLARRLVRAFEEPFEAGENSVAVLASIGVAVASNGMTSDDLLRNADMAMYASKGGGKGRSTMFEPDMEDRLLTQLRVEAELRVAVVENQFRVLYQPVVDIPSGRLIGTEALVRWQHPTRGMVPPVEFIPLAEQTGIIVPIGAIVLEKACHQAARWAAEGAGPPISMSVNVSPRQLVEPGLVELVARVLQESQLDPRLLTLEMTETALVTDAERTELVLRDLKALGVKVALDDFGTGFSSLSHLRRYPIDTIKVDKSFIDGMLGDGSASALARAILEIGRILSVDVIAEGVESKEQLEILRKWDCPSYQGYLFSPPIEAREISAMLNGDSPTDAHLAVLGDAVAADLIAQAEQHLKTIN